MSFNALNRTEHDWIIADFSVFVSMTMAGKVYSFLQPRDAATFECRHQSLYLFAFTPRHNQQLPNKILHPTAYSHVRLEPLSRLEYEAHGIGRKKIKIKTIFWMNGYEKAPRRISICALH